MRARGFCAALAALTNACAAPMWQRVPYDRFFQRAPIELQPPPPVEVTVEWWDAAWQGGIRPLGRALSPATYLRMLTGPPDALDVNAFGQVPDSSWFTNRAGLGGMTPEQMRRGPNQPEGPPVNETFTVIAAKTRGVTPGLVLVDSRGQEWVVKFDPPAYPELASGAEMITSRVLWAAGYNVPENYLAKLDIFNLRLSPKAVTRNKYNAELPLTPALLNATLAQLNPGPDGRVRAVFSRAVPGVYVGRYSYDGTDVQNPADRIPHERRRSLRGLRLVSAWLNEVDIKQENTLDQFVLVQGELGYVRHYLIDFGSSLGSYSTKPKPLPVGYANLVYWDRLFAGYFALGLYYPYWLAAEMSPYISIGMIEAEVFDPEKWQPNLPNAAFEEADPRDLYWAASIVAQITPDLVAAAISTAKYSNPGAVAYITRVLLARREKVLRWGFSRVLPLDYPTATGYVVGTTDLAVSTGLERAGAASYEWRLEHARRGVLGSGTVRQPTVDLRPLVSGLAYGGEPFVTLSWWRPGPSGRGPRVEVHLRVLEDGVLPVGVWREVE